MLEVSHAVDVLNCGEIVAFPTETVYGLGANAYDDAAVSKIFQYKDRPSAKPLSICYSSFDMALDDVELDDRALVLAEKFLPGPLTIVLKRRSSSRLSGLCSAGLKTIGVRVPAHPVALKLLSRLSFPLAAPSANKSGYASPTTAEQVLENFKDILVLNGGECSIGIASTIVDLCNNKILRTGAININEINGILDDGIQ
ncbi:MAG: threonylcarbamoyl-AMP synthase [Holosporaceae bacterium]|jgi:L-threonylcarbamoyladenylate synthase|nr:threonylcarbamoyl-AMP synthase [Holosporaceae bacterium]